MEEIECDSTIRYITTSEQVAREDDDIDALIEVADTGEPSEEIPQATQQNIIAKTHDTEINETQDSEDFPRVDDPIECKSIVDKSEFEKSKLFIKTEEGRTSLLTYCPSVVKIPHELTKSDHLGINAAHHTLRSCTVQMQENLYNYIQDVRGMKVPFDPPVSPANVPSNFITFEFTEKQIVNIKQSQSAEHIKSIEPAKPEWRDPTKVFPETIVDAQHFKDMRKDISDLVAKNKIEIFPQSVCKFLTEACFSLKHLSRMQILVSFLALSGVSYRKICSSIYDIDKKWRISKNQIISILMRTFTGNYYDADGAHGNLPALGYIDSLILITEIDLNIVRGTPPQSSWVVERAKFLRNQRLKSARDLYDAVYGSSHVMPPAWSKIFNSKEPEFDSAWLYKFSLKAGFVNRQGEPLERARGVHCTAATLIRWSMQFGRILESYNTKGRWVTYLQSKHTRFALRFE